MDYLKEYKSFISGQYLGEGVRKTAGILLPSLILGYFGFLKVGMIISLGALCISIADNPSPFLHRMNIFIITTISVFVFTVITGFAHQIHWLWFILLPLFCFFFSLISVYGKGAGAIGIAVLLVIILQMQYNYAGWAIVYNGMYLFAGGCWYVLLCIALYSIRPYKIAQQALGEYVMSVADYLKIKASLYEDGADYKKANQQLVSLQVAVQEKQSQVADLIFKMRRIVQESTHTGRVMVMAFLDITDLFEITMSSHQNYEKLHSHFEQTTILSEYRQLILALAGELDKIGLALQSGNKSVYDAAIDTALAKEKAHLQELRLTILNPDNVALFISLKHILDTIDNIATRIQAIHYYTTYDRRLRRKKMNLPDPEDFISHQEINLKILWDNLSFQSNIFRHSLRIAAAAMAGVLIARFFVFGHSYWILLTIVVILKPAYSITKERNLHRLLGTLAGVAISAVFLFFIKNNTVILLFMAVNMIGAYSFIRKQYFIGVLLLTIYLLLMFHLIGTGNFTAIIRDRILDTLIGSLLAWIFSYIIPPIWEQNNMSNLMVKMLDTGSEYYRVVAEIFTGKTVETAALRISRKNSLVALANLSDAFNRMLSEPKSKQEHIEQVHQFVVSVHMLISHIATLANYTISVAEETVTDDYVPLILLTQSNLNQSSGLLKNDNDTAENSALETEVRTLDNRINHLMHLRQEELRQGVMESTIRYKLSLFKSIADQFYFIYKIAVDIRKISGKIGG